MGFKIEKEQFFLAQADHKKWRVTDTKTGYYVIFDIDPKGVISTPQMDFGGLMTINDEAISPFKETFDTYLKNMALSGETAHHTESIE